MNFLPGGVQERTRSSTSVTLTMICALIGCVIILTAGSASDITPASSDVSCHFIITSYILRKSKFISNTSEDASSSLLEFNVNSDMQHGLEFDCNQEAVPVRSVKSIINFN